MWKINVKNLKFNSRFPKSPKQQKTKPIDEKTQAARAMLDTGKRHIKMTKKQISLNTLEKLGRKQLGTEDVEQMSKKVIKDATRKERDIGYINFIMRRRCKDAEDKLRRAKVEWRITAPEN